MMNGSCFRFAFLNAKNSFGDERSFFNLALLASHVSSISHYATFLLAKFWLRQISQSFADRIFVLFVLLHCFLPIVQKCSREKFRFMQAPQCYADEVLATQRFLICVPQAGYPKKQKPHLHVTLCDKQLVWFIE
jgi:Ni,Fe-hydrogenase I cytochrome b subunit